MRRIRKIQPMEQFPLEEKIWYPIQSSSLPNKSQRVYIKKCHKTPRGKFKRMKKILSKMDILKIESNSHKIRKAYTDVKHFQE